MSTSTMTSVKRALAVLARIEDLAAAALTGAVCLVVALQIFWTNVMVRLAGGGPLIWTDEVARLGFVWMVFLGASVAARRGMHFSADVGVTRLPPRARAVCAGAAAAAGLAFAVLLIWQGTAFAASQARQVLPALQLPKSWMYAGVPVFGALLAVHTLEALLREEQPG